MESIMGSVQNVSVWEANRSIKSYALKTRDQVRWSEYGVYEYGWLKKMFAVLNTTGIKNVNVYREGNVTYVKWDTGHYKLTRPDKEGEMVYWDTYFTQDELDRHKEEYKLKIEADKKVVSLTERIDEKNKKKKEFEEVALRLTCSNDECDFVASDEDQWDLGLDIAPSKKFPFGTQDSGRYVCPECNSAQKNSVWDGMVRLETTGPSAGIHASVPMWMVQETIELIGPRANGEYFNPGSAMLNAIRGDIIKHFKEASTMFFPVDTDEILEQLKQEKGL